MAMKLKELYVYPIKSLRATPLTEAIVTKHGFAHDRRFMLLKVHPDRYENMAVAHFPQMVLFLTSVTLPSDSDSGKITVTYTPPEGSDSSPKTIEIPLLPDTSNLQTVDINMHGSPTKAYVMSSQLNAWFTSCFEFPVILAYLGDNRRKVMFDDMRTAKSENTSWLSSILKLPTTILGGLSGDTDKGERITFADCASYLITSQTSLDDVSSRLPPDVSMDITKFRPNIVLSGSPTPWAEDFWGEVVIGDASFTLVHNCVRCASINIDYSTGKPDKGEEGSVLKKLQRDRRVDSGAKWSPVFGRYGFLDKASEGQKIEIGDEAKVTKVNKERTVWNWEGLG
jgi:uncharacterized protein YcbX